MKCSLTGLTCLPGCDGTTACAGLHTPLNEWPEDDEPEVATDDLIAIGEKVNEAAMRAKDAHAHTPGASARWYFEVDDVRFRVVVSVAPEGEGL